MATTKKIWEQVYTKFGTNLPWCIERIPQWFPRIVHSGWIRPCKALDVGCGRGDYAAYLAKQGYGMTGIDISQEAISLARKKHVRSKVQFMVHDAFELASLHDKFDFIYDISLLHNIEPARRDAYAKGIRQSLCSQGKAMICCFSRRDVLFKGKKMLYFPELRNTVYPLTEEELRNIFKKYFHIERIETVYFGRKNKRQRERLLCLLVKK
jgi:ubiquinone/menaquinone biosynthesis C-methylase UbiE